jgi:integrase/recombinase XerD
MTNPTQGIEQGASLAVNAARFRRHLRATGLAAKTETTYLQGVEHLVAFLAERRLPTDPAAISREHLTEWLVAMRAAGRKPATIANRYRSVQQFFKWAADEGIVGRSPMAGIRPPRIPEDPPAVLRDEHLTRLLRAVDADKSFAGRRDAALIRVFIASGARLAEVAGLRWTPG